MTVKFPTLFKRTKHGSIQQWSIIAEDDHFYTIEGIVDGKLTTSKPTYCKAKNEGRANETSAEEQANKEAQAKHEKKLNSGYAPSIELVDVIDRPYEPMLAQKWKARKKKIKIGWNNLIYVQPKLDGVRCICKKDGMWTRNGKKIISAPHIFEALKPYFDKDPNLIFDGELYCDKLKNDFNKIISLVRKTKPTADDLKESRKTIQYWIYDLPSFDEIFSKRNRELGQLLIGCSKRCLLDDEHKDMIVLVDTYACEREKQIDDYYSEFLSKGMEGQILRLDAKYENKRSNNLLKRKEFQDAEYEIIDVGEGQGNRAGMVGQFVLRHPDGKKTFNSNVKGSHDYLKELWKNKNELIGKMATCVFFELTPDNTPRFPFVHSIRDYE